MTDPPPSGERPGGSFRPATVDVDAEREAYSRLGSQSRRYLFAREYCHGKAVVDFGCGFGMGRLMLAEAPGSYIGIDTNPEALAWASNYVSPAFSGTSVFFNAKEIERVRATADVVLAFEVIEHVANPVELVSSMVSCLRPGGTLILSTPNGRFFDPVNKNPYHVYEYHWAELDSILRASGLRPDYFKEVRVDHLDVFGRVLLGTKLRGDQESDQRLRANSAQSLKSKLLGLYRRLLDGPSFWRISRASVADMARENYSTQIAVCRQEPQ